MEHRHQRIWPLFQQLGRARLVGGGGRDDDHRRRLTRTGIGGFDQELQRIMGIIAAVAAPRFFERIAFDAPTELVQGERRWPVTLLDLSLKGLLIERPEQWEFDDTQDFEAIIHLDADTRVEMQVELRHEEPSRLGFICLHIDLDSMTHLHRLVELNVADSTEMMRELRELIE